MVLPTGTPLVVRACHSRSCRASGAGDCCWGRVCEFPPKGVVGASPRGLLCSNLASRPSCSWCSWWMLGVGGRVLALGPSMGGRPSRELIATLEPATHSNLGTGTAVSAGHGAIGLTTVVAAAVVVGLGRVGANFSLFDNWSLVLVGVWCCDRCANRVSCRENVLLHLWQAALCFSWTLCRWRFKSVRLIKVLAHEGQLYGRRPRLPPSMIAMDCVCSWVVKVLVGMAYWREIGC